MSDAERIANLEAAVRGHIMLNTQRVERLWEILQSPDSEIRGKLERFLSGPDSSGTFHFPISDADVETLFDMEPMDDD